MNAQYLMYKHTRVQTPYEQYIKKKKMNNELNTKKDQLDKIFNFRSLRYPRQLLVVLQREINPFQNSLQKLKQFYNFMFPQYAKGLVHDAVQFIFQRKCEQSQMLTENAWIIESGNENIRNGRKLQKEDFTFDISKLEIDPRETSRTIENEEEISYKKENDEFYDRVKARTDRFNLLLMDEIKKKKSKFENIKLIEEDNEDDSLYFENPTSRREKESGESFPKFRQQDMLIQQEGMDTGRTDIEELNEFLTGINNKEEEEGDFTGRSRTSNYTMKISKELIDNLNYVKGGLKITGLVKKIVDKMKKQQNN